MPESNTSLIIALAVLVAIVGFLAVSVFVENQRYIEYQNFASCRGVLEGVSCFLSGNKGSVAIAGSIATMVACTGLLAPLHVASFGLSLLSCGALSTGVGAIGYFGLGGSVPELLGGTLLPFLVGLLIAGLVGGIGVTISKTGIAFAPLGLIGFIIGFMLASWIVANWILVVIIGTILFSVAAIIRLKMAD